MRTALRLATVLTAISTAPAWVAAADWTISGGFSQRFELDPDPTSDDSVSLGSTTSLSFLFRAETPTTTYFFAPGFSASFFSDDDSNVDSVNSINPRFNGGITHRTPRWSFDLNASVIPRQTRDARFGDDPDLDIDPIATEEDAIQIDASLGASVGYAVDARNSIGFGVNARAREYTDDTEDLRATRSLGTNLSWSRALSETTSANVGFGITRFTSEDREDSTSLSTSFGLSHAVNTRLQVNGSIGVSYTEGGEEEGSAESNSGQLSFNGGFGASYQASSDTSMDFSVSQAVAQNEFGEITDRISVRSSIGHEINNRSSVSASARYVTDNPAFDSEGDTSDALVLTASYRHNLSDRWNFQSGYSLRNDFEDSEISNLFFITISRNFDILD